MKSPSPPPNIATELARERTRAAAERTLMAWIRTCLSLISFGFGIDRIVYAIERAQVEESISAVRLSRILGLAFIALGTFAMLAAVLEHRVELRRVRRADYAYRSRLSLGLLVAVLLVFIGLFAFISILLQAAT